MQRTIHHQTSHRFKLVRPRPTDATGWFWALVALLAGAFYGAMYPPLFLVALASPICFFWQFKKWSDDRCRVHSAAEWCREHYPNAGGTPVVDFVLALIDHSAKDISHCDPFTAIDSLNWMEDDDWLDLYPECDNVTQAWLAAVLSDARITDINPGHFHGRTIHDTILLVISGPKAG